MSDVKNLLCDGREDVKAALEGMEPGFGFTLRSGFDRAALSGESVTWGEWSNLSTDCPVVDELSYQVTVRAGDLDRLRALCAGVNAALTGLGLKRIYTSPDEFDDGSYNKTLRFGRRVDKRTMRLVD